MRWLGTTAARCASRCEIGPFGLAIHEGANLAIMDGQYGALSALPSRHRSGPNVCFKS